MLNCTISFNDYVNNIVGEQVAKSDNLKVWLVYTGISHKKVFLIKKDVQIKPVLIFCGLLSKFLTLELKQLNICQNFQMPNIELIN